MHSWLACVPEEKHHSPIWNPPCPHQWSRGTSGWCPSYITATTWPSGSYWTHNVDQNMGSPSDTWKNKCLHINMYIYLYIVGTTVLSLTKGCVVILSFYDGGGGRGLMLWLWWWLWVVRPGTARSPPIFWGNKENMMMVSAARSPPTSQSSSLSLSPTKILYTFSHKRNSQNFR